MKPFEIPTRGNSLEYTCKSGDESYKMAIKHSCTIQSGTGSTNIVSLELTASLYHNKRWYSFKYDSLVRSVRTFLVLDLITNGCGDVYMKHFNEASEELQTLIQSMLVHANDLDNCEWELDEIPF